jgi:hypothetical protein
LENGGEVSIHGGSHDMVARASNNRFIGLISSAFGSFLRFL